MGRGGNSSGCARGSFWLPEGEDVGFAMMWPRVGSEGASAQKVLSACSPLSLSRSSFCHSLLALNSIFSDSSFCVVSAAEPNLFGVAKSVATWTLLAPRLSSQRDPFVCVCSAVSVSETKPTENLRVVVSTPMCSVGSTLLHPKAETSNAKRVLYVLAFSVLDSFYLFP